METENKIIKKGRSREEKEQLLSEWKSSGKTRKEFCLDRGINYGTFATWPRECNGLSASAFKELKLSTPGAGIFAQIHFPSGVRIEFYQPIPSDILLSLK